MNDKEFKKMFGQIAEKHGFKPLFTGWYKESDECIIVLGLQKSNFGDYYQLNIKPFVQGMFGKTFEKSKELVKKSPVISNGVPKSHREFLDLDVPIDDTKREKGVESLFDDFLQTYTECALSKAGLKKLYVDNGWSLSSHIREELERLMNEDEQQKI